MPDLATFSFGDLIGCASGVRTTVPKEPSMHGAADAVGRYLFDAFGGRELGQLALVRTYKTHRFGDLPDELRAYAERASDEPLRSDTRCLVLLASAGAEEAWNDVARSRAHRAIPLATVDAVARSPMIAALIRQLGHDVTTLARPASEIILDTSEQTFNVFHVEDAEDSEFVPDKAFVDRYGVRSVLGFGGVLPPGELFATILFSRRAITRAVAELFAPVALSVKLQLLPFAPDTVFA